MPNTVVLTGITGFIAKHIALQLLEAGYQVRGTLRSLARADEVRTTMRAHLSDPSLADTALDFAVADLGSGAGWAEAMEGAQLLMHTASPFPMAQPKDPQDLIRPAVDGTKRVLEAAAGAGIKRIVLTSSSAAVMYCPLPDGRDDHDETSWSDLDDPDFSAYGQSKTLAERAAWEVAEQHGLSLTTINPTLVLGPPLDDHFGTSLQIVDRLLAAKDPMMPDIAFSGVDVRDVAEMHIKALNDDATIGERFISYSGHITFVEMAKTLNAAYPGKKIATRQAPKFVLRLLGIFDPAIRSILPEVGNYRIANGGKAEKMMGMKFIPLKEALLASAAYIEAKNAR